MSSIQEILAASKNMKQEVYFPLCGNFAFIYDLRSGTRLFLFHSPTKVFVPFTYQESDQGFAASDREKIIDEYRLSGNELETQVAVWDPLIQLASMMGAKPLILKNMAAKQKLNAISHSTEGKAGADQKTIDTYTILAIGYSLVSRSAMGLQSVAQEPHMKSFYGDIGVVSERYATKAFTLLRTLEEAFLKLGVRTENIDVLNIVDALYGRLQGI